MKNQSINHVRWKGVDRILPLPAGLSPVLILIMLAMALSMSYTIYLAVNARDGLQRLVVYIILAMMNSMLAAPLFYFLIPGNLGINRAVELSLLLMMIEVVPFLVVFMRRTLFSSSENSRTFLILFTAFFVIVDELLMSLDFNIITQSVFLTRLVSDPFTGIIESLTNYWFVFPMGVEMIVTTILLRKVQSRSAFTMLTVQGATMILVPTALSISTWVPVSIYLSGSLMTAFFVFTFEFLYRVQGIRRGYANYLIILLLVFSMMMAGIFLWQISGNLFLLAASMIADMSIYLYAVMGNGNLNNGKKLYWLTNRVWSFLFLALVFCSEFFMGAAFDAQFYGPVSFLNTSGLTSISGNMIQMISEGTFDFFRFFADVSLSAWFLVMMGIEMGSLVVFKIRKTRDIETKTRLALMLVAYGVYSILLPSFVLSDPKSVPFIGWTMGIGTAGPFTPLLIVPIVLTYVISGILSLLFGSRQLCSVFCTAPVMYQGTFYDSMKGFNRQSGTAKTLTKGGKNGTLIFRIVSSMVYISIIVTAVLSWLDSTRGLGITFYGTDPEYMMYLFYFGFLWYAVFIMMPFVGSYGCINTGYCSWGNFNRFISRFGVFRLKVHDPSQCVTCPTKDCTLVCPVGNSGQPGAFISKGEYKSSRCVGIGDCVNACPYENIYYYDIRHLIKERIRKREN